MAIERVYAGGRWLVGIDSGIAEVMINRPPLNLITIEMRKELERIIEELDWGW